MEEASTFRDQAARYRAMLNMIDDLRTRDVLAKMAVECDAKAEAAEKLAAGAALEEAETGEPSSGL